MKGSAPPARSTGPFGLRATLLSATVGAAFVVIGSLALLEVHLVDARLREVAGSLEPSVAEEIGSVIRTALAFGAAGALLVATVLGVVLARLLVGPLERLTDHARALQAGQLEARLRWERRDELGQLAGALDAMAEELLSRIESLRAERGRLAAVFDAMAESVAVVDAEGRVLAANRSLAGLLGVDPVGRRLFELFDEEPVRQAWRRARRGARCQQQGIAVRPGGLPERIVDLEAAPLDDRGVVLVLHDVTASRRAERARRDFVAAASHELRTPLTVVGGYAETLLEEVDDPALRRQFAERILEHTRRMQRLAADLLALSRAEADDGQLARGVARLDEVVEEAWAPLEQQARQKGVTLDSSWHEPSLLVAGSPTAVRTIVANLLENAVRYGPEGRPVRVRSGMTDDGGPWLLVEDEGPGIAPEHHERIFERFYRVDRGRSRTEGGTGLGLALVKHLCARIGAEVSLDSAPGEGSRFRVRFRAATHVDSDETASGAPV